MDQSNKMAYLKEVREKERAGGTAAILAIATATPPNCIHQDHFPDFYFRITDSDHMTQLKAKLKRICKLNFPPPPSFSYHLFPYEIKSVGHANR